MCTLIRDVPKRNTRILRRVAMNTVFQTFSILVIALFGVLFTPVIYSSTAVPAGSFDCTIYPSADADIGSTVAGVIENITVDRSDTVGQGDVLAVLEASVERSAVALASARALAAAEIEFGHASAENSESQLAQTRNSTANSKISRQEVDHREAESDFAQVQLQQALQGRNIPELELAYAMAQLSQKTIRSPYSGVIVERYLSVGEHVNDQPILKLAQIDPLHVETQLPAIHLGAIQSGMFASVSVAGTQDAQWEVTVERVDAIVDVASGRFGVRLILPNPDRKIVAGTRCKVSFSAEQTVSAVDPGAIESDRMGTTGVPFAAAFDNSVQQANKDSSASESALSGIDFVIDEILADMDLKSSAGEKKKKQCIESRFFTDRKSAIRRASELRSQSVDVVIVMKKEVRRKGFKVMSPSLQSQEAIEDYVARLEATGVSDYYAYEDALPARVAVGAFVELTGAQSIIDQLARNDIPALLFPWEESLNAFYLKPGHPDVQMCDE